MKNKLLIEEQNNKLKHASYFEVEPIIGTIINISNADIRACLLNLFRKYEIQRMQLIEMESKIERLTP